jgi:transcriptional regulator with XRE-family HTH domain
MDKKKIDYDLTGIGRRLKSIRKHLKLRQLEFASILNVTVVTLSDIETGKKKPGSEMLFILSEVYRVNLAYLLHGEGDMYRPTADTKGIIIEEGIFGDYTNDVKEILWYMQHSRLARSAIITMAKEYLYRNEDIVTKDLERQKEKDKASAVEDEL